MRKIAYLIIVSFCITSCEKYKKQPEPVYCFPDEPDLYAYAYFKPGSYWVYQDSISGILDSVYITYANKGTYTNGDEEVKMATTVAHLIGLNAMPRVVTTIMNT